jgi:hypothetical protein
MDDRLGPEWMTEAHDLEQRPAMVNVTRRTLEHHALDAGVQQPSAGRAV